MFRGELDISDRIILLEHILALPLFLVLDLYFLPNVHNLIIAGRGNH